MSETDGIINDDNILKGSVGILDTYFDEPKPKTFFKKKIGKSKSISFNCKCKFNFILVCLIILFIVFISSVFAYYYLKQQAPLIKTILYDSDIKHSLYDNRYYKVLNLPNDIKVLMILMQDLNFTSCSMSIESGSNDDTDIPGIAHLSYQLYMQELQEGKFSRLIKSNLGTVNGEFKDNLTSFYFEVEKNQFLQAFIEFSQIFQKERVFYNDSEIINVIESIDSNYWRDYHDENILTRHASLTIAFGKNKTYFPSGNKQTFGNNYTLLNEKIIEYRKKTFVGNKINLVFYSDRLPSYIKGLAIKYFGNIISSYNETSNQIQKKVPLSLNLGKIGFAEFDRSFYHNVDIFFYFDKSAIPEYEYYLKYIQYLVNDKKLYNYDPTDSNQLKYSVIKMLRHLDVATNVTTAIKTYAPSIVEFNLKIETTVSSEQADSDLATVIEIIFSYFFNLQTETSMDLIKDRYEDFLKIMHYNFKMRPFKNEYASYAQSTLNYLIDHIYTDPSHFIMGDKYIPQYNETIIKSILDNFIPEKAVIIISTNNILNSDKNLQTLIHNNCSLTNHTQESVYNMKYSSCDINFKPLKESAKALQDEFQIRSKNEYITDLEVPLTNILNGSNTTEIRDQIKTKRHYVFYHKVI